jgi:uncharacterized membrane protein
MRQVFGITMTFREKLKTPDVLMMIGLVALVCANMSRYAFHGAVSDRVPDFVMGAFYGIGIPTLLLSVARRVRGQ